MSIMHLFRKQRLQKTRLFQTEWRRFAHDPSKTSAAAANPSTAFPIGGKPSNITLTPPSTEPQVKVTLQKPKMDIVLEQSVSYEKARAAELARATSFANVPGPVSLKMIHRFFELFPTLSKSQVTGGIVRYFLAVTGSLLSWSGNIKLFNRFFSHYGPVVRMYSPLGGDLVLVSRPEHVATVFKNEGPYPIRSSLDSVEKYRLQCRKLRNPGPFLMFGPEWENFRKTVEQPMPVLLANQFDKIDDTCDKFLVRISDIRNRQEEVPGNFYQEILKWCLECICLVTLDKRLGFLDPCGLSSTSDPGVLLDGIVGATRAIQRCEFGLHLWQFMTTPAWRALVEHCDSIDGVMSKYVHRIQAVIRDKKEADKAVPISSLMESVMLQPGMLVEDAMTILLDMMLIGVNATSHTVAFLLYHLAKNPRKQAKLYAEVQKQPKKLSKDVIAAMPYLQACIKESLRLSPPVPLLGRVLQNDISIYNYHIPKGTYVMMFTVLSGAKEEYFEDATKFVPERWMTPSDEMQSFAFMPFGYGAKACLGKELAEMQVGTLITKILKTFKVEYLYSDIKSNHKLWAAPKQDLKFRFVHRE